MLNKLRNHSLTSLHGRSFVLFIIIIISLFLPRIFLSVSTLAFCINSFLHRAIGQQIKIFFRTKILVGMSMLFFIALISGLWSEDKDAWMDIMRIKLPLAILPIAFASPFIFLRKQWDILAAIFIVCVIIGTGWSIYHYLQNVSEINASYLRAKTIITPFENDHVRFSWVVCIGIFMVAYLLIEMKASKWLLILAGGWLIVYLHLLAARTGLAAFYILLLIAAGRLLFYKSRIILGMSLLVCILVLPFLAYKFIPSFHNRVTFFVHERAFFEKANYLAGGTDAVRIISIKGGWEVMNQNLLKGTGFGDIKTSMIGWYDKSYPGMKAEDKIYPSSEFLIYGLGSGWGGLFFFIISISIPFFEKMPQKWWWSGLNAVAIFSMIFDIPLEVQFGVFIYSFIILWCWKWFTTEIN